MVVQLRVEDRLKGVQNFPTWKEMIMRILDVSDAEEHIDSTKVAPTAGEVGKVEEVRLQSYVDHLGWGEGTT